MNKLMIVVVTAAAMVGGAYAADCKGCETTWKIVANPSVEPEAVLETAECVAGHVWDLSIKAKTLGNKCTSCPKGCVTCGDTTKVNYYDNTSRTFTGIAWTCYCPCVDDDGNYVENGEEDSDGLDLDNFQEKMNMLFWDAKNSVGFGYIQWSYTPVTCTGCADGEIAFTSSWELIDITRDSDSAYGYACEAFRYGKKATNAAWGFGYSGTGNNLKKNAFPQTLNVAAAGLGTVKTYKVKGNNLEYIVINKLSGACIGDVTAYAGKCDNLEEDDNECFGLVIPVCYNFENWCEDGVTTIQVPFYGTFTAKYNATKSQKLRTAAAYLGSLIPTYCQLFPHWISTDSTFDDSDLRIGSPTSNVQY